jgi:hypothetical protein
MIEEQQQLELLAQSGPGWAATRAQMALAIMEQYAGGGLDSSEYTELMTDLVRSDHLDREADNLETKTMLVTAIYGAAQLI